MTPQGLGQAFEGADPCPGLRHSLRAAARFPVSTGLEPGIKLASVLKRHRPLGAMSEGVLSCQGPGKRQARGNAMPTDPKEHQPIPIGGRVGPSAGDKQTVTGLRPRWGSRLHLDPPNPTRKQQSHGVDFRKLVELVAG